MAGDELSAERLHDDQPIAQRLQVFRQLIRPGLPVALWQPMLGTCFRLAGGGELDELMRFYQGPVMHRAGPGACPADFSLPRPAEPPCGHPQVDTLRRPVFCCHSRANWPCACPPPMDAQWWPAHPRPCWIGRAQAAPRRTPVLLRLAGLHCHGERQRRAMRSPADVLKRTPMRQAANEHGAGAARPHQGWCLQWVHTGQRSGKHRCLRVGRARNWALMRRANGGLRQLAERERP